MNKYGQYCPMARAIEVLGDRWTLLILRDMLFGAQHFNELERGLPGISKALLTKRLRELQQAGLLERHVDANGRTVNYELTAAGRDLKPVVDALIKWGARWSFGEPRPEELDPLLLMWWMRDGVCSERLPDRRILVEFSLRSPRKREYSYWMLLEHKDSSLCVKHPGFEIDVLVHADLATLYEVWLGHMTFAEAQQNAQIEVDAIPALVQAFPTWFTLSPMASVVRPLSTAPERNGL